MAKADRKLTPKQKIFCKEYIVDLNASQAMIRAGYSATAANVGGSKMLANSNIRAEIDRLMHKRSEKLEINAENVLNSILDIRASCVEKYVIKDPVSGEPMCERMVDISGALKANELLGKHLKLFTDKVEHSGKIEMPTIVIGK